MRDDLERQREGGDGEDVARQHDRRQEKALRDLGMKPVRREGLEERRWVLLDFVDIVVHVFAPEEREYYDLERLWRDAPVLEWADVDAASG